MLGLASCKAKEQNYSLEVNSAVTDLLVTRHGA